MESNVIRRIHRLRQMTIGDLQLEWMKVFGEPARSTNREHLWKRLAWKVQEQVYGGLSERAKTRIEELVPAGSVRAKTPNVVAPAADPALPTGCHRSHRDPRLPSPGTVISKTYKGTELRVTVRDDGYEFDGAMYASLTAVAKHLTGCKSINGKLFFGLTQRKRN